MTIHSVANSSELDTALSNAVGGDTIECATGTYGSRTFTENYGSEVIIKSVSRWGAKFNSIFFGPENNNDGCTFITLEEIDAEMLEFRSADDIRVSECRISDQGNHPTAGSPDFKDFAMRLRVGCNRITIEKNTIKGGGEILALIIVDPSGGAMTDLVIDQNYMTGAVSDAMQIQPGTITNLDVTNNVNYDATTNSGSHSDFIQLRPTSTRSGVNIRGNYVYDDENTGHATNSIEPIFFEGGTNNSTIVEQNLLSTYAATFFWVSAAPSVIVRDNSTMPGYNGAGGTFKLVGDISNGQVLRNVFESYDGTSSPTGPITFTDNHYYGSDDLSLIYQGGNDGSDWADFKPVAASAIENIGALTRIAEIEAGTNSRAISLAITDGRTLTAPGSGSATPQVYSFTGGLLMINGLVLKA